VCVRWTYKVLFIVEFLANQCCAVIYFNIINKILLIMSDNSRGERLVKLAAKQNAGNLIAVFLFRVSTQYPHYFSSTKQTCVQQGPRMGNY
jgi:hypothetical protein